MLSLKLTILVFEWEGECGGWGWGRVGMVKSFIYEMSQFTKFIQAKIECFLRFIFIKVVVRLNGAICGFLSFFNSSLQFIFIVIVIS